MELIPWRNKNRTDLAERSLAQLRDEITGLFDRFFGGFRGFDLGRLTELAPPVEVREGEKDITVRAELPGVRAEDVRIEVTGHLLTIGGEKRAEKEEKRAGYRYSERQFGAFQRMVQLPAEVDADRVEATHQNGVLTIRLPKRPGTEARRVKVRHA